MGDDKSTTELTHMFEACVSRSDTSESEQLLNLRLCVCEEANKNQKINLRHLQKLFIKKMKSTAKPTVIYHCIELIELMMAECGSRWHFIVGSKEFLERLMKLCRHKLCSKKKSSKHSDTDTLSRDAVEERILMYLCKWGTTFVNEYDHPDLFFSNTFNKIKQKGVPIPEEMPLYSLTASLDSSASSASSASSSIDQRRQGHRRQRSISLPPQALRAAVTSAMGPSPPAPKAPAASSSTTSRAPSGESSVSSSSSAYTSPSSTLKQPNTARANVGFASLSQPGSGQRKLLRSHSTRDCTSRISSASQSQPVQSRKVGTRSTSVPSTQRRMKSGSLKSRSTQPPPLTRHGSEGVQPGDSYGRHYSRESRVLSFLGAPSQLVLDDAYFESLSTQADLLNDMVQAHSSDQPPPTVMLELAASLRGHQYKLKNCVYLHLNNEKLTRTLLSVHDKLQTCLARYSALAAGARFRPSTSPESSAHVTDEDDFLSSDNTSPNLQASPPFTLRRRQTNPSSSSNPFTHPFSAPCPATLASCFDDVAPSTVSFATPVCEPARRTSQNPFGPAGLRPSTSTIIANPFMEELTNSPPRGLTPSSPLSLSTATDTTNPFAAPVPNHTQSAPTIVVLAGNNEEDAGAPSHYPPPPSHAYPSGPGNPGTFHYYQSAPMHCGSPPSYPGSPHYPPLSGTPPYASTPPYPLPAYPYGYPPQPAALPPHYSDPAHASHSVLSWSSPSLPAPHDNARLPIPPNNPRPRRR